MISYWSASGFSIRTCITCSSHVLRYIEIDNMWYLQHKERQICVKWLTKKQKQKKQTLQVPGVVVLVAAALLAGALWPRAFCACSDTTWTDSDAMNRKGYQAGPGFTLWTLKIVHTKFIHLVPCWSSLFGIISPNQYGPSCTKFNISISRKHCCCCNLHLDYLVMTFYNYTIHFLFTKT